MSNKIEIIHFDCVDSTNRMAMQKENKKHLLTILADTQTSGRGRMGREFYSYNGGLYMSVIIDPYNIKIPYHICTPAAAIAVKKCLENIGVQNLSVKWVNDILSNGKKVCGILTEAKTVDNKIERLVIGIGINLEKAREGFPDEIKNTADFIGLSTDKEVLCRNIVNTLASYLIKDHSEVVSEYSNMLGKLGDTVTVSDYANNCKITGKLLGVDDNCYLKIELPDKSVSVLSSGEIIG